MKKTKTNKQTNKNKLTNRTKTKLNKTLAYDLIMQYLDYPSVIHFICKTDKWTPYANCLIFSTSNKIIIKKKKTNKQT